ncbi:MAG: exopolysaccharide biosynthesis polyprenyl glycosylphosphotransferase [Opitutae bacterium]|nr:exopolysaccharide biosynthesis polyprenyl glycosylphosphotransferase [Opitutae bacterium]
MLLNRHRGLAELHSAAALLLVALFFWVYAEFTIEFLSEIVRVTTETPLMPYFLSVVLGMLLAGRAVSARGWRLTELGAGGALALASQQVAVVALVVFAMMFATQDRSISRLFLGTFLVFVWGGLAILHVVLPRWLAGLVYGGGARIPALVLARAENMPEIEAWLAGRRHLGLDVTGYVSWQALPEGSIPPLRGWLGASGELAELIRRSRAGQVIFWELPAESALVRGAVEICQTEGARVLLRQDIDERLGHPAVSVEVGGQHYFTLHDEPLEEPLNRAMKRVFDIAVALPVVVLVLPPLALVVWLVQRRQSPGPLLHIRARAGEQRQQFSMLKFRTMHVAPADARSEALQASRDDARVYPFGRFLRRHSLDEFPQFWNVLIGEMSVVGPRPVMPLLDEEFERRAKAYRTRHYVKPGITGLAQSEGLRGEITSPELLEERVRRDLRYIAEWSIWLDVQITLATLRQVFRPPGSAY